jgi:hypothetical protein
MASSASEERSLVPDVRPSHLMFVTLLKLPLRLAHSFRRAPSLSSHASFPTQSPHPAAESTPGTAISDLPPYRLNSKDLGPVEPEPEPEAVEEEPAPERERDAIERGIVSENEAAELHRM